MFECGLVLISVEGYRVDIVVFRNSWNTSMMEVFKQLVGDLAEFFEEYSGEVEGGVIEND
ncbi:MAG: hypothetical protein LZ173_10610 [Thaumarchaeota archaeon]|nr:hypothetical protein [Candidatus Geocrenenecus arthurdayi]